MSKAYKVILGADITGQKKAVLFAHGVGLLDRRTHREQYLGMYQYHKEGEEPRQMTGPTIEDYADYWRRQGAKVEEINEEAAEALRETITKRPSDLAPKPAEPEKTDEPIATAEKKPADDGPVDVKPAKTIGKFGKKKK